MTRISIFSRVFCYCRRDLIQILKALQMIYSFYISAILDFSF